jgi:PAS domain S-box-containing protein
MTGQLDYLLFLHGLSFIVLAAVCFIVSVSDNRALPWRWLMVFAVVAGVGEWLDLATFGHFGSVRVAGVQTLCLLLAFLFLLEFGRAGVCLTSTPGPKRWWVALVGIAVLPAWIIGGIVAAEAAIRMGAGLVGGSWAALALVSVWRTQHNRGMNRLLATGVSLGLYAVYTGLQGALMVISPDSVFSSSGFELLFKAPVQVVGISLVLLTTVLLMGAGPDGGDRSTRSESGARSSNGFWMLLAVLTIAALGWGGTELAGREGDTNARRELLLRAQTVVSAVDPEQVTALDGTMEDIGRPHYEALRAQLSSIRSINYDCRFVYLMGLRGDQVVFLADSEEEGSKDYSPPGEVYEEASPELRSLFATGKAFVEGPITDAWGTWISAHAAVREPSSQRIVAIVGLDIKAANWQQHVGMFRLTAIAVVFTISLLTLAFFISLGLARRGRAALAQSEERYRTLFEKAQDGIFLLDGRGMCVDCNQAAEELFHVSRGTFLGGRLDQFFTESISEEQDTSVKLEEFINQTLSGQPLRFESRACRQGGNIFDVDVTLNPVMVGSAQAVLAQVHDISSQKARQQQVIQERERLAAVLDATPVACVMIDRNAQVLFWNRAAEVLCHTPRELVQGKSLNITPFIEGRARPSLAELLLSGTEPEILKRYTGRGSLRYDSQLGILECRGSIVVEGEKRNVRIMAGRVHDTAGNLLGVIQCVQDVTHEEALQQQLMHAEKMQSIGTLASGMAHEFNNILAAIRGYAQLVVMKLGSEHPVMTYLHQVDASCQRAASLTQRMLAFSRADSGMKLPLSINDQLEGVCHLLKQTMPPEIEFELDLQGELPLILADPNQVEQVIVNLAVNARDAMPKGGTIRISSRLFDPEKEQAGIDPGDAATAESGSYAEILVEDDGSGMPPELVARAFDPFFTTKEPGKGTGLGLYIVYSILKSHHGWVKLESEVGKGSRFRLYLPVLQEPTVENRVSDHITVDASTLCGQGESVLVVDDEAPLRAFLQEALTAYGYQVTLAENGLQALDHFHGAIDGQSPFDLVLLDLAMPVMRGEECLQQLLSLAPQQKVLLMSGMLDEIPPAVLCQLARGLLRKPFRIQGFLTELRTILEQN